MSATQAFAYQPIVDATQSPVAVELIYRGRNAPDDNARNVANVVLNALLNTGPVDLPHRRLTYLSAPADLLVSGLLEQLPGEMLALEVSGADAAAHGTRCRELKQVGYRLVLDGRDTSPDQARGILSLLDVARFDAATVLQSRPTLLPELRASGVQLLAHDVEHADMLADLKQLGFSLFQGYYFVRPLQQSVARVDPRKLAVLDLLAKLAADADDPVIEDVFKANPELALHLLRIVNSSAFALKTRIRSIKHAFAILGRKQLERWLQVLLFACDGEGTTSPLMELALRRARFMEFVLIYRTHQGSTVQQDEAYMTGLLSLVDVLLGWSMQETVERLGLADTVRQALLQREGTLGQLIALCEALEAADFDTALPIAEALHLPLEAVMTAQNVALSYSEHVGQGAANTTDSTQP